MKRCIKCILPENYPGIDFDKNGRCNFCREHKRSEFIEGNREEALKNIVNKYKNRDEKYDCIVAFSGGRDSSYILWYAVEKLKLNVLACFMDNGMVPEHTFQNVKNATRRLGVDLHVQKYDYLEKSVKHVMKSWMRKPCVGMIAIFCTGCAFGRRAGLPMVANEYRIPLMLVGGGEPALSFAERYLYLGRSHTKMSLIAGFALEAIKNPRYLVNPQCSTIMTLEFAFRFLEPLALKIVGKQYPQKKVFPYEYIGWDEQKIVSIITSELGWQRSPYSESTWRSDCKIALLKNYLYQKIVGFNKHDDLFGGMIRDGLLKRDDALSRLEKERDVKEEFVKEFFRELGLNYDELQNALKKTSYYKWFQNLQSGSKLRRGEGFNRRNIFNISSIESLGPTQKLGLRGDFETTSTKYQGRDVAHIMNVAYFSNHLVGSKGHGIERYARSLYEAIHNLQTNISLIPVSSLGEDKIHNIPQLKIKSDLKLLPWGRYMTALSWGFLKRPFLEHWLKNSIDLVHAPNLGYPVPTKKPYVVTVHDIGPLTRPEFFSKRSIRWMKLGFPHMVKKAAAIICVSKATADEVISRAGNHIGNRLYVIHEGVDPLFLNEPDLKCLEGLPGLPPQGTPFCLAAGAISPRKNLLRIVMAMEKLKDDLPHHLCLVGGTGWNNRKDFDRIRNSKIADRIHHLGYVSDAQLHALYASADVFVYPSLFEGFGLPVIEAMASGCPVVTSNISSLPEVAGDAAVLVDPYDIFSIKEAIYQVCSNHEYAKRLSELGKKRASRFTWKKCALKVVNVYKSIS